MPRSSAKHANMNKEISGAAKIWEPAVPMTRARAKASQALVGLPPRRPSLKQEQKPVLRAKYIRPASDENQTTERKPVPRANNKRPASDENQTTERKPVPRANNKRPASDENQTTGVQHKRWAVLKDVTNSKNVFKAQGANQSSREHIKNSRKEIDKAIPTMLNGEDTKAKLATDLSAIRMVVSQGVNILRKEINNTMSNTLNEEDTNSDTNKDINVMENLKEKLAKELTNIRMLESEGVNILRRLNEEDTRARLDKNLSDVRMVESEGAEILMKDINAVANAKAKIAKELSNIRMRESQVVNISTMSKEKEVGEQSGYDTKERRWPANQTLASLQGLPNGRVCENSKISNNPELVNIDADLKDPLLCSLYAADLYYTSRLTELERRPLTNYMEKLQPDITSIMRGILIDWLVEVSEEYKLVPDTLYLTVDLIDRFLSLSFIEKQRLQLVGVTCMMIASKFQEICSPRAEEFCLITDNTYTKEEVLQMEVRILKALNYQLAVPTTKTFLRRFIRAAQASYKVDYLELEFAANYLAELTLVDYNFLKFMPSLIAASAVFLALWTLDQSDRPWNPTLVHYTTYQALDLKSTVLAIEELQLNTTNCLLNAIRQKYKQDKFKKVANLKSRERVQSFFSS